MNKRAIISFNVMNFIPKIIFLAVVVLSIVFIVRGFVITDIDTRTAESYILINRIMYSPNTINYYDDDIERLYPGIVDLDNFNTERLEKAISPSENSGAKLTLLGKEKTIYYNEEKYNRYLSYATVKEEEAEEISTRLYVLVRKDGKISSDILNVSVVVR